MPEEKYKLNLSEQSKNEMRKISEQYSNQKVASSYYVLFRETEDMLIDALQERIKTDKEFSPVFLDKTIRVYNYLQRAKYVSNVKDRCQKDKDPYYTGWVWVNRETFCKNLGWTTTDGKVTRKHEKNLKKCTDVLAEIGFIIKKVIIINDTEKYAYFPVLEPLKKPILETIGTKKRQNKNV